MSTTVFSDFDHTLAHPEEAEFKVPNEDRYLSQKTVDLVSRLREAGMKFNLCTGRRKSSVDRVLSIFVPDRIILENGCLIMNGDDFDPTWAQQQFATVGNLGEYQGVMWDFAEQLREQGYTIDNDGRFATFRVFRGTKYLTEKEKSALDIQLANSRYSTLLISLHHDDFYDILPKSGGKDQGIAYLIKEMKEQKIFTMGNDNNDLPMLNMGYPLCPGNAVDAVKGIVRQRGGYVSIHPSHKGTEDMLEKISRLV